MGVAVLFMGGTQLELSQVDNVSAGARMVQVLQTDPLSPGLWDSWERRRDPKDHLSRMAYLSYILL